MVQCGFSGAKYLQLCTFTPPCKWNTLHLKTEAPIIKIALMSLSFQLSFLQKNRRRHNNEREVVVDSYQCIINGCIINASQDASMHYKQTHGLFGVDWLNYRVFLIFF